MKIQAWFLKKIRRWLLKRLAQMPVSRLEEIARRKRLRTFKQVFRHVPAYRELALEAGISPPFDSTPEEFWGSLPVLEKSNTFERFDIEALMMQSRVTDIASVLTSSGHSGLFALGMSNRQQFDSSYFDIDLGLEQAFGIDDKTTLVINVLPMGVRFSSKAVTLAETSVREDMALAILHKLEKYFEQIILVADPLFLKRVLDYASDSEFAWPRHKMNCVIGEETFHEHFRDYVATELGCELDNPESGLILSTMGVGELGLNLFYECRETIAIKRKLDANPALFEALFGFSPHQGSLMLFVYNPLRTYIETYQQDELGIGDLLVSMLGTQQLLPLLRYRTGDRIRLLQWDDICRVFDDFGLARPAKPILPIVALVGRKKELLPNGVNLSRIKDLLYQDAELARQITGAWRLEKCTSTWVLHIQANPKGSLDDIQCKKLASSLPFACRIHLWPYMHFPFGMTLDYERKFCYWEGEDERLREYPQQDKCVSVG